MTKKDEDQDWLDALAGKPSTDADPDVTRRASALRKAIQLHGAVLHSNKFDAEAGLQKLKFRLRREDLSGADHRPFLSNRFVQFAMAASVVLTVGLMMRNYLPQELPQNEAEIMRGLGDRQIVLAANPEEHLKQLTTELDRLGIKYQVERNEGKIMLKIRAIDPAKEDVSIFMERNHIKPPVGMDVMLDIRPMPMPMPMPNP